MKEKVRERIMKTILFPTLSTLLSEPRTRQQEIFKGEKKGTQETSFCFCLPVLLLVVVPLCFETALLYVKLIWSLSM